jgi:hypothetical protein
VNDLRRFSDAVWPVADEPHDPRALARLVAGVARRLEAVERRALGQFGLTPATFRLLDLLAREGAMAPSEAAQRLEVRQPTVTGWLKALRDAVCSSATPWPRTGGARAWPCQRPVASATTRRPISSGAVRRGCWPCSTPRNRLTC